MKTAISKNAPTFLPTGIYVEQEGGGLVCVRGDLWAGLSKPSRHGKVPLVVGP